MVYAAYYRCMPLGHRPNVALLFFMSGIQRQAILGLILLPPYDRDLHFNGSDPDLAVSKK
jgi:hypothetical protein